jgi:endonuclease IV
MYHPLSLNGYSKIINAVKRQRNLGLEYLELDLLNLPRDLSTNLNEDSDNQKENVVPSKKFRMVTDEETGVFLRGKSE